MSITYEEYTFTVEEMHVVVRKQREESARMAKLGEAAFDDMSIDDFLSFDMGRTLAILDYYHLIYLASKKP